MATQRRAAAGAKALFDYAREGAIMPSASWQWLGITHCRWLVTERFAAASAPFA